MEKVSSKCSRGNPSRAIRPTGPPMRIPDRSPFAQGLIVKACRNYSKVSTPKFAHRCFSRPAPHTLAWESCGGGWEPAFSMDPPPGREGRRNCRSEATDAGHFGNFCNFNTTPPAGKPTRRCLPGPRPASSSSSSLIDGRMKFHPVQGGEGGVGRWRINVLAALVGLDDLPTSM